MTRIEFMDALVEINWFVTSKNSICSILECIIKCKVICTIFCEDEYFYLPHTNERYSYSKSNLDELINGTKLHERLERITNDN